ncbi:YbhB/YbcL family Raf kinase inhibitor-like protein [Croceicoccus gelatinilyticus]|uniref:YbhB/YbcL family Raf kinase inhibitor-like protein n=1 Tax=Croceicoccus gelatinilyticus TaxID=2835536 RepID=UPI001BCB4B4E|nr:YbhB/YbcL family Raf kinase inhibitor-like protein [Croceicoccus gelatinilyticus]MBS7668535.1 YbhB/YbcL family Raf kinase inhibitor-like protein [Croceicoccus gelatinilyticus]
MSECPAWLEAALNDAADGSLTVASLGSASLLGAGGLKLTSAAFEDGEELDPSFTADEEDAVAPPMEWNQPPEGTMEMAIVVEDATAGAKCHWLVWGIAPQRGKLMEGEVPPRTGKNGAGNSDWLLPALADDEEHSFVFQLYALDAPLNLAPGASRKALVEAMQGHVISVSLLTGTYAREKEIEDWDDIDVE